MSRLTFRACLLVVWVVLLVGACQKLWAADGGAWELYTPICLGDLCTEAVYLCDGKIAADSTCPEFDLEGLDLGLPSFCKIRVVKFDPECSGTPDFTVRTYDATGETIKPTLFTVSAPDGSRSFDVDQRFLDVTLADDAACDAPGNDLVLICWSKRGD